MGHKLLRGSFLRCSARDEDLSVVGRLSDAGALGVLEKGPSLLYKIRRHDVGPPKGALISSLELLRKSSKQILTLGF